MRREGCGYSVILSSTELLQLLQQCSAYSRHGDVMQMRSATHTRLVLACMHMKLFACKHVTLFAFQILLIKVERTDNAACNCRQNFNGFLLCLCINEGKTI